MTNYLDEYFRKAQFPKDDKRFEILLDVTKYLNKLKAFPNPITYQQFVNMIYKLKKAIPFNFEIKD